MFDSEKFHSDFEKRLSSSHRMFNIIFNTVLTLTIVVFITWVVSVVFLVGAVAEETKDVDQVGLKGVIERVWCGKDKPNCL